MEVIEVDPANRHGSTSSTKPLPPTVPSARPYEFYLNPFELLDYKPDAINEVDPSELRRCKNLLLAEIKLNEGRIPWLANATVYASDAHAVLNDLDDPQKQRAHLAVLHDRPLLRFLTHGELKFFGKIQARAATPLPSSDKAFLALVSKPFASQYGRALVWAYQSEDLPVLRKMASLKLPVGPAWKRACFEACERSIKDLVENVQERRKGCAKDREKTRAVYQHLSLCVKSSVLNALPQDLSDARSDLANAVRSISVDCFNDLDDAALARDILRLALSLDTSPQVKVRLHHDWSKLQCIAVAQNLIQQLDECKTVDSSRKLKEIVEAEVNPDELNRLPESLPEHRGVIAVVIRKLAVKVFNDVGDAALAIQLTDFALRLNVDPATHKTLTDDANYLRSEGREAAETAQRRKALEPELKSKVSEVTISGGSATVPAACTCCLGKADSEQKASYSWQETRGITRYNRSLSFSFPVCASCLQHQQEYNLKRWSVVLIACGMSSLLMWFIATSISQPETAEFVIEGAGLAVGILYVASWLIKLRSLADDHACRTAAVTMCSASDHHCTFRFQNPIYGDMFARANKTSATLKPYSKPPRGEFLLSGQGLVFPIAACLILSVIAHFIIYGAMEDSWKQRAALAARANNAHTPAPYSMPEAPPPQGRQPDVFEPLAKPPDTPSNYQPPAPIPASNPPSPRVSVLSLQIDAGKAKATAMESEIDRMDSQLDLLSSKLKRFKSDIDDYESRARVGIQVNDILYQQAIDDHNRVVHQYNDLLGDRNLKYAAYEAEIEAVNAMVGRFNRGER